MHLKAGRTPEDFERREAEAKALRGYLQKLVSDDKEDNDIIILGDFNHDHSSSEAEVFKSGAFAEFLTGRGRSIIHFDRQIDYAVPLGTFDGTTYDEVTVPLETGDVFVFCTDGVYEAVNEQGEEFGVRRVVAVLEACAGETAQGIVDAIFEAVTAFEGRAAQHDDLTAVAVTFRG